MKTLFTHWLCAGSLLLATASVGRAQNHCLLVPVPLAERVAAAPLVVEAGMGTPETVEAGGHLYTLSELTVYQVFRGAVPGRLRLVEAGGTLGLRREVVTPAVTLAAGQQGVFLLEPSPVVAGAYRLVAGPQGWIRYDLATRSATEPFGRYASLDGQLYPALEALTGQARRALRPNPALAAPRPAARPLAPPAISGFAPASLAAGRDDVLTINGANFGATQGSGRVEFPNANNGGSSFVSANANDYVLWSDTQIQVRVPSLDLATGAPAGTGTFRVVNGGGEVGSSPAALRIVYALSNVGSGGNDLRVRVINDDGQGGYTLQYSPSFTAEPNAPAAFARALASWNCGAQLQRRVSTAAAAPEATASDGVNAVRFGTLPNGVLGVANSYYQGCAVGGVPQFSLTETDYTFAPAPGTLTWQFGPGAPTAAQYDFESVALHELGHGAQLTHIIDVAAVMHYAIANGQSKRTLNAASDIAGANDVFAYSVPATCGFAAPVAGAGCALPVTLVAFAGQHEPGRGTWLRWATASEQHSAYFALEARDADAEPWREVLRQPAAGSSSQPRHYRAHDPRALNGLRYYRLRQADLDGRVHYSPLVAVAGRETTLALYPNPATDRLRVSAPGPAGQLRCYDLAGRLRAQFALEAAHAEIDVQRLPAGLYQLEWTDGRTRHFGRLEKQ